MATITAFDPKELESKVKAMYRSVAEIPHGDFHFEMGRAMAERLGYSPADLDRIPAESIESFAGVGHYFHLADLRPGDMVVDLGSGSGMDTFIAALKVDARGKVTGVDMTDEQRKKAERLRDRDGFLNVTYLSGYIEDVPLPDNCADAVISNGRDQSGDRQIESVQGGRTPAQERWPLRNRRHRDGGAAAGQHRLQLHPLGGMHRGSGAARRLPAADRTGGAARGAGRRQSAVPVHLR